MDQRKNPRPALLTVIGWCFIAIAGISIISGIFSLFSFAWMNRAIKNTPELLNELPQQYQMIYSFLTLIYIVIVFQVLLSVFILLMSVEFLKMRAWARTGLEFINWFAILISTELVFFSLVIWILGKTGVLTKFITLVPPHLFDLTTPAFVVLSWALAVVPLFLVNRVIRRKEIRELFQPSSLPLNGGG
jgi:hypothetical protein